MTLAVVVTVLVMLVAALGVVVLRSYLAAIVALSVVSLALSVLFALLRAPDVALAEASVGAGLTGLLMALAARRVGLWPKNDDREEG